MGGKTADARPRRSEKGNRCAGAVHEQRPDIAGNAAHCLCRRAGVGWEGFVSTGQRCPRLSLCQTKRGAGISEPEIAGDRAGGRLRYRPGHPAPQCRGTERVAETEIGYSLHRTGERR